MTKTQRTLYFAGICVAILAIGLLMLLFAARTAHAAALVDFSTLDGTTFTSSASGGQIMQYGQSGSYGWGSPSISLPSAVTDLKMLVDTGQTCPGASLVFIYGQGGTIVARGDFGQVSFIAQTGDFCEYSISTNNGITTFKGLHINGGPTTYQNAVGSIDTFDTGTILQQAGKAPAFQLCDTTCTGGFVPPVPPDSSTSIVVTNPTQGTTTPTTTFDIEADYNIGTDLPDFTLDGSLPTKIGISLVLQNTANGAQINLGTDFSIASSSGAHSYSTTTTAAQADYTLIATLVGVYGTNIPAPPDCTPLPPFQTCTGTTESTATLATSLPPPTFSVANGTFPLLGFQVGSSTSRAGLATTTCSVLAIGGCFQNALAFLFYPSPDILDQFRFLWGLIQNKPPFGYVSQTITGLRSLNASSTPAFSFGSTLPLVGTIFTPFRTGLAGILWVGFFIAWYRGRLRHLDI